MIKVLLSYLHYMLPLFIYGVWSLVQGSDVTFGVVSVPPI